MDIDKLLRQAELFETATKKHHGYGLVDKPTATPDFIMWKVTGHDDHGNMITANIYAYSEEEAKNNFVLIYPNSTIKEVKIAKDLLK